MRTGQPTEFDVVIMGSGMAGGVLGAILARAGHRVLILDAKEHPRFAIGESTIPQTSQLLTLMAKEFGVPELSTVGLDAPAALRPHIGNCCGIKRHFGFAYHQLDREHDPAHGVQFGNVWSDENHLFRQEVDFYLLRVALGYGCQVRQRVRVTEVEIGDRGVRIESDRLPPIQARFVVDGTGYRSLLAHQLGLRDDPPRMRHHSRCLFNHFVGVEPFEDCAPNRLHLGWSKGTLHHVFEHGWIWIIPFNNWEGSTNPLVSVGLTLDPRFYPEPPGVDAEEEFETWLERLPSIARQFENAQPVREWVRTGRLQYSSSGTVGSRFCLLSHAAGFVDALYSRGLVNTMEVIHALAPRLLEALDEDRFELEHFQPIDELQQSVFDYADRLAYGSFAAWSDFEVWNAWLRVWMIGTGVAESNLGSYCMMGSSSPWRPVDDPVFSPFEHAGYRDYFDRSFDVVDRYSRDELDAAAAAEQLWQILGGHEFVMALPDRVSGHEWALKNPLSRDLFLGSPDLHQRWAERLPDPHLTG